MSAAAVQTQRRAAAPTASPCTVPRDVVIAVVTTVTRRGDERKRIGEKISFLFFIIARTIFYDDAYCSPRDTPRRRRYFRTITSYTYYTRRRARFREKHHFHAAELCIRTRTTARVYRGTYLFFFSVRRRIETFWTTV